MRIWKKKINDTITNHECNENNNNYDDDDTSDKHKILGCLKMGSGCGRQQSNES